MSLFTLRDNARDKSFTEIATGFVAPPYLGDVNRWEGSLVLGPRGSGKTTLFKALSTGGARAFLECGRQDLFHGGWQFVGVYVPADDHWRRATDALDEGRQQLLYKLLVAHSMIGALVDRLAVASDRISAISLPEGNRLGLDLDPAREYSLAQALAGTLGLLPSAVSLRSIRSDLHRSITRVAGKGGSTSSQMVERVTALSLADLASSFVRTVDEYERGEQCQWVLLLDELENAPSPIHSDLWHLLRNPPPGIRLKIAYLAGTEPLDVGVPAEDQPQAGHDYRLVRLAMAYHDEQLPFAEALATRLYSDLLGERLSMSKALGPSALGNLIPGKPRSEHVANLDQVLSRLAERDPTYAEWLSRHPLTPKLRGKIAHTACVRDAYNRHIEGGPRLRTTNAYVGWPVLGSVTEGNPRRITWLIDGLIRQASARGKVARRDQARVLQWLVERQRNVLGTLRLGSDPSAPSVLDLVKVIGEHFRAHSTEGQFREDPVNCFRVDRHDIGPLRDLTEQGLRWGGFVELIPRTGRSEPRYRRLRLDGLMAVSHRLSLKVGKSHLLRSIQGAVALETGRRVPTPMVLDDEKKTPVERMQLGFFTGREDS